MTRDVAGEGPSTIEAFVDRHREWAEQYIEGCKASSETVRRLLAYVDSGEEP